MTDYELFKLCITIIAVMLIVIAVVVFMFVRDEQPLEDLGPKKWLLVNDKGFATHKFESYRQGRDTVDLFLREGDLKRIPSEVYGIGLPERYLNTVDNNILTFREM